MQQPCTDVYHYAVGGRRGQRAKIDSRLIITNCRAVLEITFMAVAGILDELQFLACSAGSWHISFCMSEYQPTSHAILTNSIRYMASYNTFHIDNPA